MSTSLYCTGLAASFGARTLFSGLDLTLAPGDVTALVGPNGSGKTTLLRIIAGEHPADTGQVRLAPKTATIGYLPQSLPEPAESVLAYAQRRTGVAAASVRFERASTALAAGDETDTAAAEYAEALEVWLGLGGADLESRLAETLSRLGLDPDLERPLGSLSGGQAARVGLASILVSQYDLLLLDEPTNNLDAEGLAALRDFTVGTEAPTLVASHDRAFLDAVATSVLELDLHQQQVQLYSGGWSAYREAKTLARAQAEASYADYLDKQAALTGRADRQTRWAAQGRAKAHQLPPHSGLAKKWAGDKARRMDQRAAMARAAAERLEVVDQPRKEWELRYMIGEAEPSADLVVSLDHVVLRNGDFILGPFSAEIARGDRIALVGANGTGKSTLVSALLGELAPASGRISWGGRVQIGRLDQERRLISGTMALSDRIQVLTGLDEADARTLLAKFGLGPAQIVRPCDGLSLGERTRAALAVLQATTVNLLVLDEPTNHLDVPAIEQLERALSDFGGTLVIVSHDQVLVDALQPLRWQFIGGSIQVN